MPFVSYSIPKGSTSVNLEVQFELDTLVTVGAVLHNPAINLAFNTAGVVASYKRPNASAVGMTLVSGTLGTWTDKGFVLVDNTAAPGLCQIGLPDAAFATGVNYVVFTFYFTGVRPTYVFVSLTDPVATAASITDLQTDIDNIQTRLPAALVSGRMDSSVGAMATGTVTADAVAANAIGASEIAADAATEIGSAAANRVSGDNTIPGG